MCIHGCVCAHMQEDRVVCVWSEGACSLCETFVRCSGRQDWEGKTLLSLCCYSLAKEIRSSLGAVRGQSKQAVMVKVRPVAGSVISVLLNWGPKTSSGITVSLHRLWGATVLESGWIQERCPVPCSLGTWGEVSTQLGFHLD